MTTLKILHLNNISNISTILSAQQGKMGHTSCAFDLKKPFGSSSLLTKIFFSLPVRLMDAIRIRRYIRKNAIDIVHVHYVPAALLFLGIDSKLIVHAHGSDVRMEGNSLRKSLNAFICRHADSVLYSTPDLKKYLDEINIKSTFIPNPVDIENFYETTQPDKQKILLYVPPTFMKGAEIAIPALAEIKRRHPFMEITCFNFGDRAYLLKNLPVTTISKQNRSSLKEIVSSHGIILGQFIVGAIGMAELEALCCKRPVICNFLYDHFYDEPSPFFQAQTTDNIIEIIESFISAPNKYWENKDNYRNWVIKYHSKEAITEKVIKIYQDLL